MYNDWRKTLDEELNNLESSEHPIDHNNKAGIIRRAARRLPNPPSDEEVEDYIADKGLKSGKGRAA